jgi:hypothetical protein
MSIFRMRAALILIAGLLAAPAAAQTPAAPAGAPPHPQEIQAALERQNKHCLAEGGGKGATFGPKTVRRIDLNGDGRDDYILDLDDATCDGFESLFCGTGGCEVEIFIAQRSGSYRSIFLDRVLRYEILPGRGVRTIRFRLHGGYCGRHGPDRCEKARHITGAPFRFRK